MHFVIDHSSSMRIISRRVLHSCTSDLGVAGTAVRWVEKMCRSGSSRCSERPEGRWRWCPGGRTTSTWRIRLCRCKRGCHWTACCAGSNDHCLQVTNYFKIEYIIYNSHIFLYKTTYKTNNGPTFNLWKISFWWRKGHAELFNSQFQIIKVPFIDLRVQILFHSAHSTHVHRKYKTKYVDDELFDLF